MYRLESLFSGPECPAREIRWVDFNTSPPTYLEDKTMVVPPGGCILDMCYVHHRRLLVAIIQTKEGSTVINGLYGYDTETKKLRWRVWGRPPGMKRPMVPVSVTTDGEDQLFVSDSNIGCIYHFTCDGEYLGEVVKERVEEFGEPRILRWWTKMSSLVAVYEKDSKVKLCIISA